MEKKVSFTQKNIQHKYQKQKWTPQQKKKYIEQYIQARLISQNFSIFTFKLFENKFIKFNSYMNPKLISLTFDINKLTKNFYDNLSLEMNKFNRPKYLIEKITDKTFVKYKIYPIKPFNYLSTKETSKENISPLIIFYYSDKDGNELNNPLQKINYITLNIDYLVPIKNNDITLNYAKTILMDDHTGVFYFLYHQQ
jgi:hypothetical protein